MGCPPPPRSLTPRPRPRSDERGHATRGCGAAEIVRYRSSWTGQSAPTAWLVWWPSRSAVDDPPDTRDQISSPRAAPAPSARTGIGGGVPWTVRGCPSSSNSTLMTAAAPAHAQPTRATAPERLLAALTATAHRAARAHRAQHRQTARATDPLTPRPWPRSGSTSRSGSRSQMTSAPTREAREGEIVRDGSDDYPGSPSCLWRSRLGCGRVVGVKLTDRRQLRRHRGRGNAKSVS
jgi:hypothetical protein